MALKRGGLESGTVCFCFKFYEYKFFVCELFELAALVLVGIVEDDSDEVFAGGHGVGTLISGD